MSGIAGVFNRDSAAPDRELASRMAQAIKFRGPHGAAIWTGEAVFFVHTLLKTTYEAENEKQPTTLGGKVWITADARIDGREDLVRELNLQQSALTRPDCELILHAYARWGEKCVEHLLGDFAFAIWDGSERKLFCARDHFGVKPFFYSLAGSAFVFSNTLECVRVHPAVADELNPLAIADFLIFNQNQNLSTTTFRDILRLPPAHTLVVREGDVTVARYWSLPSGDGIRYAHPEDYVEHFRAIFGAAVKDRLRLDRVAVYMSGGLDSTAVAALARQVAPETDIKAFTWIYENLIEDDEGGFAGLTARQLGAEIEYLRWDDAKPLDGAFAAPYPEPYNDLFRAATMEECRNVASYAPVALTGHGGDPAFSLSALTEWESVRTVPLGDFARHIVKFVRDQKTVPRFRLRSTVLKLFGLRHEYDRFETPVWLDSEFSRRFRIQDRVSRLSKPGVDPTGTRPATRRILLNPVWPWLFETQQDAGWTGSALEFRNPFFDIRLVRWLLSIPELPYMMDKWLLRMALRGMIPDEVRTRKKRPLRTDPNLASLRRYGLDAAPPMRVSKQVGEFINWDAVPVLKKESASKRYWLDIRPVLLNYWCIYQEDLRGPEDPPI